MKVMLELSLEEFESLSKMSNTKIKDQLHKPLSDFKKAGTLIRLMLAETRLKYEAIKNTDEPKTMKEYCGDIIEIGHSCINSFSVDIYFFRSHIRRMETFTSILHCAEFIGANGDFKKDVMLKQIGEKLDLLDEQSVIEFGK